ncbi:MAG TPA: TetR/AcrR family transcriptional regulator [Thermoleophilaceae bacterium]|nr:TetR/AcrR family transcriptional regulator [Thermoleophilaceae bacterium]
MPDHRSRPAKAALATGVSAGRTHLDQLRGGKHGLTPEQVASSQRERVLAAMRELVATHGYRDVSVAGVLRHAGVSRKTFYELYPGKEECFVAVYEDEMERLLAPVMQAFEGSEPWVDRLRTALGVLLGALAGDPSAARICFVEVLAAGPLALERRAQALAALDPLFAPHDGADERDAEGARTPRSRAVTAGSVGYLAEVLHREIAAGHVEDLPLLRAQLTDTLTLPFTGGGRDGKGDNASVDVEPEMTADDAGERAFLAGYGEIAADVLGTVSAAMAVEDDPAARIRAGVAALLDFCADRPDRARALFVEALSAGPAARERRSETTRRLADLLAQPLRELRPNERIADVSAIALVGGFHELSYTSIDRLEPDDLPTVDTIIAVARL